MITPSILNEVIALASSPQLLSGSGQIGVLGPHEVVSEFSKALSLATDQQLPFQELSWVDVRAREMAQVNRAKYQLGGYRELNASLRPIHKAIESAVLKSVDPRWRAASDDIAADLANIATARAIGGHETSAFFKRLFAAYREGGWPVGLQGDPGDGKLFVFWPKG